MANMYLQTSGDFDRADPLLRLEARQDLFSFLERHRHGFREMRLHAHVKFLNAALGSNILVRCTLNLFTNDGKFHVVEEGFGLEAAIKSAILAMRYQVEKRLEVRLDSRAKVEGRKAVPAEG